MKCIQVNKKLRTRLCSLWKGVIILLAICIVVSCTTKQFDSEQELCAYIKNPENGYYHEKVIGAIKYELTYRPTDILVKQELGENASIAAVDSLRSSYGKYLYFNLSMSSNGQELLNSRSRDKNAFGTMVSQLAFGMKDKVQLISKSRDTLSLLDYNYPRMYGTSKSTNMLLIFPRDEAVLNQEYCHIAVKDFGFETGEVGFKLYLKFLKNEPKLNIL